MSRHRAEILTALAWLAGWALVTYAVAALTTPLVWPLSAGLLLLGLAGYRLIGRMLWDGLYTLTRTPEAPDDGP